jgi:hypothetical protein
VRLPILFLEVFAESRPNRDLPFVPTLLCLWGSGLVTSFVTSFLLVRNAYALTNTSPFLVAVGLLVDAAVGRPSSNTSSRP